MSPLTSIALLLLRRLLLLILLLRLLPGLIERVIRLLLLKLLLLDLFALAAQRVRRGRPYRQRAHAAAADKVTAAIDAEAQEGADSDK